MAIGMALGGILSKNKQYESFIIIGAIITLGSFLVLSFGTFKGIDEQLFWPLIFRGFGIGLVFVPLSNISLTRISEKHISDGSALFNILRQFGGALGITFASQLVSITNNSLLFGIEIEDFAVIAISLLFFIVPIIILICIFSPLLKHHTIV
jgi:DHA2 family multidrug resistance protein